MSRSRRVEDGELTQRAGQCGRIGARVLTPAEDTGSTEGSPRASTGLSWPRHPAIS